MKTGLTRKLTNLAAAIAIAITAIVPAGVSAANQSWGGAALPNPARLNTAISTISVANDSTLFAVIDSDADGVFDDLGISADGGASFPTVVVNVIASGTAIVDIVPSPTFSSDRNVFAAGGTSVFRSIDGGTTWATSGITAATGTITTLAVAPNFAGGAGDVALGWRTGGLATNARKATCVASPATGCGTGATGGGQPQTDLPATVANNDASEGILAIAFSPQYLSDGAILAIAANSSTTPGGPCGAAAGNATCELRSLSGSALNSASAVAVNGALGASAKIAFPSGYSLALADSYFVATDSSAYRRTAGAWADMAPAGAPTPASSIAVSGSFAGATVYIGAAAPVSGTVYRGLNGGTTWTSVPIGGSTGAVRVALSPNFATDSTVYASTTGLHGGLWVSTNGGGSALGWVSKGLFADNYTTIGALYAAPPSGSPMFAIYQGAGVGDDALFRSSAAQPDASSAWTKTGHFIAAPGSAAADVTAAGISHSFAGDQTVYIGGGRQLAKSINGGVSFSTTYINPIPSGTIAPAFGIAVLDSSTVLVAANNGMVHRSTDSGNNWTSVTLSGAPTITDMVLSPNYATDRTVLVAVRSALGAAAAFISADGGVTFVQLGAHADTSTAAGRHQIAFDSAYATNKVVYSVTDTDVYRWMVGSSTAWTRLSAGANVLGGSPADLPVGATDLNSLSVANGVLYASHIGAAGARGVRRALHPSVAFDGVTKSQWFDLGWVGLGGVGFSQAGSGLVDQGLVLGSTFSVNARGMTVSPLTSSSNLVLAVDTSTAPDTINAYTDLLIVSPTVNGPSNGGVLSAAPTLSWGAYSPLPTAAFTVRLSTDATFQDASNATYTNLAANTFSVTTGVGATITAPTFTAGQTYYWQVRAADSAAQNLPSPWSPLRSYSASVGTPFLTNPTSASGLVQTVDNLIPGLTWSAVVSATDYRVQVATNPAVVSPGGSYVTPTLTRPVGSATPVLQLAPGDLQPNTTYYWQVQPIFGSAAGTYTTTAVQAGASGVFKTPLGVGGIPSLVQPNAANANPALSSNVAVQPLFVWSEVAGATNYELQVSSDGTFVDPTKIVINKTGAERLGNVLAYKATVDLAPATVYFWRVGAVSSVGVPGAYSPATVFTTTAPISPVPAPAAFAALEATGKLEIVSGYNYASRRWEAYVPGLPGNTLTSVFPNSVLIVTVKAETTIVVSGVTFSLRPGEPLPVGVKDTVTITVQ